MFSFATATRAFLEELDRKDLSEPQRAIVVWAGRHICIKLYPMEDLDRSFAFLKVPLLLA